MLAQYKFNFSKNTSVCNFKVVSNETAAHVQYSNFSSHISLLCVAVSFFELRQDSLHNLLEAIVMRICFKVALSFFISGCCLYCINTVLHNLKPTESSGTYKCSPCSVTDD